MRIMVAKPGLRCATLTRKNLLLSYELETHACRDREGLIKIACVDSFSLLLRMSAVRTFTHIQSPSRLSPAAHATRSMLATWMCPRAAVQAPVIAYLVPDGVRRSTEWGIGEMGDETMHTPPVNTGLTHFKAAH